jgi:hypothetical protein
LPQAPARRCHRRPLSSTRARECPPHGGSRQISRTQSYGCTQSAACHPPPTSSIGGTTSQTSDGGGLFTHAGHAAGNGEPGLIDGTERSLMRRGDVLATVADTAVQAPHTHATAAVTRVALGYDTITRGQAGQSVHQQTFWARRGRLGSARRSIPTRRWRRSTGEGTGHTWSRRTPSRRWASTCQARAPA